MACQRKERTGNCDHHQCEFSDETEHGYECVDIISKNGEVFCEVGKDCIAKCKFSWANGKNSPKEQAAKSYMDEIMDEINRNFSY